MRLQIRLRLAPTSLLILNAIALGLLVQSGCSGTAGAGGSEKFLSITPLDYRRNEESISGIAIVPVYKAGQLQFITGGAKTDHAFNIYFGAFTPDRDVAWDFSAKYGDQNPRPYADRMIKMNDQNE